MNQEILSILRDEEIDILHYFDILPPQIQSHCRAVADTALLLLGWAAKVGLEDDTTALSDENLRKAVLYHDVGLALIPRVLVDKPDELSGPERRVLERHTTYGGRLIERFRKSRLCPPGEDLLWQTAAEVAVSHHERWDGKGYPYGVKTTASTLLSRVTAIADAYDSITRGSVYRMALPPEYAALEIVANAGTQFDPELAALFQLHMTPLIQRSAQYPEGLEIGGSQ